MLNEIKCTLLDSNASNSVLIAIEIQIFDFLINYVSHVKTSETTFVLGWS